VPDRALVEALDRLTERRLRERERDVVDGTDVGRGPARVGRPSSFVKIVISRPSPGSK